MYCVYIQVYYYYSTIYRYVIFAVIIVVFNLHMYKRLCILLCILGTFGENQHCYDLNMKMEFENSLTTKLYKFLTAVQCSLDSEEENGHWQNSPWIL